MCCWTCASSEWWKEHLGQEKAADEPSATEPQGETKSLETGARYYHCAKKQQQLHACILERILQVRQVTLQITGCKI